MASDHHDVDPDGDILLICSNDLFGTEEDAASTDNSNTAIMILQNENSGEIPAKDIRHACTSNKIKVEDQKMPDSKVNNDSMLEKNFQTVGDHTPSLAAESMSANSKILDIAPDWKTFHACFI